MNLFFAYILAMCPALNHVISLFFCLAFLCVLLAIIAMSNEPKESTDYKQARQITVACIKLLAVLALLWVLVPDQERLNTIMLNCHATYDARGGYGVQK